MAEQLAYFFTWTTYGSWLPGDQRGWIKRRDHSKIQKPNTKLESSARTLMTESSFILNKRLRNITKDSINRTCDYHSWKIHALAVCSNHVHVIISCFDKSGSQVLNILKAYCTRSLNEHSDKINRRRWWTRSGSIRIIYDKKSLNSAIEYIENQT